MAVTAAPAAACPRSCWQPQAAASRSTPRARPAALATASAAALVGRLVAAVLAHAEEPDQPRNQQTYVEDAEADHEDPPLCGHLLRW